eukprot:gene36485-biopygen7194
MRTTSPQSLGPTLLEMDSLLEEACRSIMGNCALLDRELDKLRLPISYGGCGVLSALWLAQPAFIASTSQSLVLQSALTALDIAPRAKLDSLLDRHQGDFPAHFQVTADDLMNSEEPQELLSNQIFRRVFEVLEATTVSPREGNLLVASRAESGSWLLSTPQTGFGTVMNSQDFRISLKRRIGIPIFSNENGCPRCNGVLDIFGDHAVICGGDCDVHARHNSIRDAVRDAAVYGHLNPSVETRDLLGNRRRPADVFLPNFGNGGLCIDVTVVNGFMHAQENRTFVLTEALNTADNRGFSVGAKWVIDYLAAAQRNVHGGFKSEYSAWIKRRL